MAQNGKPLVLHPVVKSSCAKKKKKGSGRSKG
jgi:hypothetical protein